MNSFIEKIMSLANKVRAFELLIIVYLILTNILLLIFHRNLDIWWLPFLVNIVFIFFIFWVNKAKKGSKIFYFIKEWYFLASFLFFYWSLNYLNKLIHRGKSFEHIIIQWEEWIFGFQPALEMHKFFDSTFLGEIFTMGYVSYYLLIISVGVGLYLQKGKKGFEQYRFTLVFTFLSCYFFFIFFPVAGPHWVFPEADLEQLKGFLFVEMAKMTQEGAIRAAAFPSAHVVVTVTTFLSAFEFNKKMAIIIAPFSILLIIGTVYGMFHFVVDMLAGIVWALMVYYPSRSIYRNIQKQ